MTEFSYEEIRKALEYIFDKTPYFPEPFEYDVRLYILEGEHALAMDNIAVSYLKHEIPMPPELFVIFDRLCKQLDITADPEYHWVARLLDRDGAP